MSDCYTELGRPAMRGHRPGQLFWVPAPMLTDRALAMRIGFLKEGQDITQAPLTIERLRPGLLPAKGREHFNGLSRRLHR